MMCSVFDFSDPGIQAFKQGLVFSNVKRMKRDVEVHDEAEQKRRKLYFSNLKKRNSSPN